MEVIFYQLFIAVTIVGTHYLKRESILLVCVFWSVFTILNLFYPPLIFIQLGVVWGTYFLLNNTNKKNRRITELEELTIALPAKLKEQVEIVSTDNKRILSGIEHLRYLRSQIQASKKSVTILSGWLSGRVVDRLFVKLLRNKLEEGVCFHIGYGWQNSKGEHSADKDLERALASLRKLGKDFPDQLFVAEYATHEKMLVVDGALVVIGSANWLSNKKYKNSERSIVVIDSAIAAAEEQRISSLVKNNKVI